MGVLLAVMALAAATAGGGVPRMIRAAGRWGQPLAGALLAVSGAYLAYFWASSVAAPGSSPTVVAAVNQAQSAIAGWLTANARWLGLASGVLLGGVRDDAMHRDDDRWWLRIPVGKLHNDRNVPLHPLLVGLIGDYQAWRGPSRGGHLLERDDRQPFDRRTIHRYVERVARRSGIARVHPHQLRHTLATQCSTGG
jgi:hypothetical protein